NIFWSLALVDWVPMPGGPEEAYQSVMNNLHNGALILLHAVSKDNTEALERILKDVKAQGYSFKTLDDLVKKGGTTRE
ncbi:MAG: delta-lactam-biosynthetic de-N-acetylase, partial [Bacillota bacterium]